MRKLFFLFVTLLATTTLWAYDFQSGDLYYNITSSAPYTVEVTYEKDFSCYNYNGLTTAIIPEEVTYNGITYSVTSIGKSAFYWCGNLTNITIPNSVTSIGKYAFDLCSSLIDVTLNSNEICGKSYTQESNISHIFGAQVTKYIIGDNVKRIGEYAFYGCSNLTNVTIGNNVTSIGSYSFSGCSNLTDITIPNSITGIGSDAFKGCSSLTAVYISDIAAWCGINFSSNPLSDAHNLYLNGELVTDLVIPNGVTRIASSAFKGYSKLNSVTIPNSVTSIGDYTFSGCKSLINITIGSGVTSIGSYAFNGCSSLTSVILPKKVRSIGLYAFNGCSNLTDITIGNRVTDIYSKAFDNCNSLKEVYISDIAAWCGIEFGSNPLWYGGNLYLNGELVTDLIIPDGVTSIASCAFMGCGSVTSVTFPNSVRSIGMRTFESCSSLTSVAIPNSVTNIGSNAFYGCSSLTNIIIPNSITSIEDYAFEGCSSLTAVTIPSSVTSIGYGAFEDCSNLTNIIIPNSITSIEKYAFDGCSSLTDVTLNSNVIVNKSYKRDSNISHIFGPQVTSYIIGDDVQSIGTSAFNNSSKLLNVTIGKNVTSIGDYAFTDCALTSVTIPDSVTNIGKCAFYNCYGLAVATIGNGVTSIGEEAFEHCKSLTTVTIGNSVTNIKSKAFNGCSSLTNVTLNSNDIVGKSYTQKSNISHIFGSQVTNYIIGDDVQSIGYMAFIDCDSLISVTIGNGVKNIGEYAFYDCSNLTSVTIGNSVTSIGDLAFYGCSSLTSITIPDGITSIGGHAFYGCSRLTSITIPNSITSIGIYAFYNCNSLTSVHISDISGWCNIKFRSYSNPCYYGANLYLNGELVTDLVIPDGVTSIGDWAFYNYGSLTSITIPNSVISVGYCAFSDCDSLTTVVCKATNIPDAYSNAFDGSNIYIYPYPTSYATLYVPKASLDKYKSTAPWSYFKKILPIEDSSEDPSNPDDGGDDPSNPDNEEDDGAITCAEAVSICQETGTTITTEEYTIRGYVTEIKTAYSEQYNNITFWMADIPNGGKVLQAYRVIPVEANDIDVKVGDYVEVIGSLVNYYGTTPEVYTGGIYTILPKQEENGSTTEEEYITACDSYEWHGETYIESGDYTYTTTTENGCEHVEILHLTIYKSEYVETSITACDSYEWHGETYTESGDYTYTTTTENGCERVEILHLMITPSDSGSDNEIVITCEEAVSICQQTGTTATTNEYTIQGYVTKIKAAYSEQHDNITFWMADISPTQMDNSSNSVTSLSDYPNIALGKSTTASSSEDSGTLPEYINDGDFNTRWSSEWQDNEYITIDLEQYSFIDHITLHWETAYASQFAILITDEQPSSSALSSPLPSSATCYQSSGDVQTIPVAKSGRYITLIGIERATAYGISLYELEAYGMPLLQAYRVKPIQSTDKYVQIGDYVEAVGTLVNYGGTTPEINAGGTYTILTKHEENGSTTSVENTNTQSSMTNCQKILYEDHIYILREDKIYNAMGQEL